MHELTLAQSIIEIAEQYSANPGIKTFEEIDIEIGELSGVVKEALEFALESSKSGTVLEKARCHFIHIPGLAICTDCLKSFEMHSLLDICPVCGGINRQIMNGKQLRIKSLKYNEY